MKPKERKKEKVMNFALSLKASTQKQVMSWPKQVTWPHLIPRGENLMPGRMGNIWWTALMTTLVSLAYHLQFVNFIQQRF